LAHLAPYGLLERLARLHEAGEDAVERTREARATREQHVAVSLDEHDHRGRDARIEMRAALRTDARELRRVLLRARAAAAAEHVAELPLDDLRGAPRERCERRRRFGEHRAHALRRRVVR